MGQKSLQKKCSNICTFKALKCPKLKVAAISARFTLNHIANVAHRTRVTTGQGGRWRLSLLAPLNPGNELSSPPTSASTRPYTATPPSAHTCCAPTEFCYSTVPCSEIWLTCTILPTVPTYTQSTCLPSLASGRPKRKSQRLSSVNVMTFVTFLEDSSNSAFSSIPEIACSD